MNWDVGLTFKYLIGSFLASFSTFLLYSSHKLYSKDEGFFLIMYFKKEDTPEIKPILLCGNTKKILKHGVHASFNKVCKVVL